MAMQPAETDPRRAPERIHTSIVPNTQEVQVVEQAIRQGQALSAYEFVQGAIDWNDGKQGSPSIILELENGVRQDLPEYMAVNRLERVKKIEVRNYIKDNKGLTPDDVAYIEHVGGEETLGQHGRGLTVTSAASLSGGFCKGITYQSVDQYGPWVGRGIFEKPRADQRSENFALEYTRDAPPVSETVITIEGPNNQLVSAFCDLPQYFLPANPRYEHAVLRGAEYEAKTENIFTVYAQRSEGKETGSVAYFSNDELGVFGLPSDAVSGARVEILPNTLVGRSASEGTVRRVYFDGLQVRSNGRYALDWSFNGFRSAENGYRVARSNDSTRCDGNPENLIASALRRCESEDVFLRIFRANIDGYTSAEGRISSGFVENLPLPVEETIEKAWDRLLEEKGLAGKDVYVTQNDLMARKAIEEGLETIVLGSDALFSVLQKREKIHSAEEALGIKAAMRATGEIASIVPVDEATHRQVIVGEVMSLLGMYDGKVTVENGALSIRLGEKAGDKLYWGFKEFDYPLYNLLRNVAALFREGVAPRVTIYNGEEDRARVFDFKHETHVGSFGTRVQITPEVADVREAGAKGMAIQFSLTDNLPVAHLYLLPRTSSYFLSLGKELLATIKEYSDNEGRIDLKRYFASTGHGGARLLELLEVRQTELDRITESLEERERKIRQRERDLGIRRGELAYLRNTLVDSPFGEREKDFSKKREEKIIKERRENPDLIVYPSNVQQMPLVSGISGSYSSDTGLEHYRPSAISFGKRDASHRIVLPKEIQTGRHHFFAPAGYRPIGYYHPDGKVDVALLELPGKNMWAIEAGEEIPPGLEVFYEQKKDQDTTIPDEAEREELVPFERLDTAWQNLIRNTKGKSDKQKVDALLNGWRGRFRYNYSPKAFTRDYLAETVNRAEGQCAEAARGPVVLLRAVAIPSRFVSGILTYKGKALLDQDSHGLVQAYMDGKWVLIEPQWGDLGYLDTYKVSAGALARNFARGVFGRSEFGHRFGTERNTMSKSDKIMAGVLAAAAIGVSAAIAPYIPQRGQRTDLSAELQHMHREQGPGQPSEVGPLSSETQPLSTEQQIAIATILGAIPAAYYLGRRQRREE